MTDKLYMPSPAGRIIQGDLITINKTDHQNRPLPENKWNRYLAIAVPKTDPAIGTFLGAVQQFAWGKYQGQPHIQAKIEAGLASGFHWKIVDGDDPNFKSDHGRGCIVIKYSTTLEIRACDRNNQQIDPSMIKRGYWVDVASSINVNGMTDDTAGLYMNPQTVRLCGYDDEIVGGPSIDEQFGSAPAPQVGSQNPTSPQHGMGQGSGGNMGGGGMPNNGGNMGGGMPNNGGNMGGGGMPNNGGNAPQHREILNGPGGGNGGGMPDNNGGNMNGGGMGGMGV